MAKTTPSRAKSKTPAPKKALTPIEKRIISLEVRLSAGAKVRGLQDARITKLELYGTANVDSWIEQHDNRIKAIEGRLDKLASPTVAVEEKWVPKKPTQLDRIERSIGSIESKLATLNAWETLNEAMSNDKLSSPTVSVEEEPQGLKDGDYTDTSKDVADKLTAMGFTWSDNDRTRLNIIGYYATPPRVLNCHRGAIQDTHYPPAEFLARAAVTAKALGLEPVEEKRVPKVGEWIVRTTTENGLCEGMVGKIEEVCVDLLHWCRFAHDTRRLCCAEKYMRPATSAEVTAHEAKVKAEAQSAEDAKLVFGARVKWNDNSPHTVLGRSPHDPIYWLLWCPKFPVQVQEVRRHEFTLLP